MAPRLVLLAPVLLLAALAACGDSEEVTPSESAGPTTPPPSAGATATPAETPAATEHANYSNTKYGYTVTLPDGWRVAGTFMEAFSERLSSPGTPAMPEDYFVITSMTEQEERAAVQAAQSSVSLGLEPWLSLASGRSIHIFPLSFMYPGVSVDGFLKDVDQGGIIRTNSNVRTETTASGFEAIRLTRREKDDNGDLTYDVAIVQTSLGEAFILRSVIVSGYDPSNLEAVWSSFR